MDLLGGLELLEEICHCEGRESFRVYSLAITFLSLLSPLFLPLLPSLLCINGKMIHQFFAPGIMSCLQLPVDPLALEQ